MGTSEISHNVHQVTDAANQTGQVSSRVLTAAAQLEVQGKSLDSEVQKFLHRLTA